MSEQQTACETHTRPNHGRGRQGKAEASLRRSCGGSWLEGVRYRCAVAVTPWKEYARLA
jgi:hypothetical protein